MRVPVPLIEPGRRISARWVISIPTAPATRTPERARDQEDDEKEERNEEEPREKEWPMVIAHDDNGIAGCGIRSGGRHDLRAVAVIVPITVPEKCCSPDQRGKERDRNRKWKKTSHL
jgi:hypothetical protein